MADDGSIAEKRVFADRAGRTDVYVAADLGLVRARVSGAIVGEFEAVARAPGADVALLPPGMAAAIAGLDGTDRGDGTDALGSDADGGISSDRAVSGVAFAADDALRVGIATDDGVTLRAVGFGPAAAVGRHAGALVAARPDGTVARVTGDGTDALGSVREPRAIDGPLVAAADGVHRVTGSGSGSGSGPGPGSESGPGWGLSPVGIDDVRDVAGRGVPLAATGDGLYWLANGWMAALEGAFTAVGADGAGAALAGGDRLYRRTARDGWTAEAWEPVALPSGGRPAAIAYGPDPEAATGTGGGDRPALAVVATDDGTLYVDAGDGWRGRALGVTGVGGVAVAGGSRDRREPTGEAGADR